MFTFNVWAVHLHRFVSPILNKVLEVGEISNNHDSSTVILYCLSNSGN